MPMPARDLYTIQSANIISSISSILDESTNSFNSEFNDFTDNKMNHQNGISFSDSNKMGFQSREINKNNSNIIHKDNSSIKSPLTSFSSKKDAQLDHLNHLSHLNNNLDQMNDIQSNQYYNQNEFNNRFSNNKKLNHLERVREDLFMNKSPNSISQNISPRPASPLHSHNDEYNSNDCEDLEWKEKYEILFKEFQNLKELRQTETKRWKEKELKYTTMIHSLENQEDTEIVQNPISNEKVRVSPIAKQIILELKKSNIIAEEKILKLYEEVEFFANFELHEKIFNVNSESKLDSLLALVHKQFHNKLNEMNQLEIENYREKIILLENRMQVLIQSLKEKDLIIGQLNSELEIERTMKPQDKSKLLNKTNKGISSLTPILPHSPSRLSLSQENNSTNTSLPPIPFFPIQKTLSPIFWKTIIPSKRSIWINESLWKYPQLSTFDRLVASFSINNQTYYITPWEQKLQYVIDECELSIQDITKCFLGLARDCLSNDAIITLALNFPDSWIIKSYYHHKIESLKSSSDKLVISLCKTPFINERLYLWVIIQLYRELRQMIINAIHESLYFIQSLTKGNQSWFALLKSLLFHGNILNQSNIQAMGHGFSLFTMSHFLNRKSQNEVGKLLTGFVFEFAEQMDSHQSDFIDSMTSNFLLSGVLEINNLFTLINDMEYIYGSIFPFISAYGPASDVMLSDSICTDDFIEKSKELRSWIHEDMPIFTETKLELHNEILLFFQKYEDPDVMQMESFNNDIITMYDNHGRNNDSLSQNQTYDRFIPELFKGSCIRMIEFYKRWKQHISKSESIDNDDMFQYSRKIGRSNSFANKLNNENYQELNQDTKSSLLNISIYPLQNYQASILSQSLSTFKSPSCPQIVILFDNLLKSLSIFMSEYATQKEYIITCRHLQRLSEKVQSEQIAIQTLKQDRLKQGNIQLIQDHSKRLKRYLDEYDELTSKLEMIRML